MAILVKADGTTKNIDVPHRNQLKFLQELVGGDIQITPCAALKFDGMVCDEEGKLKSKPENLMATVLFCNDDGSDVVVGDALFFNEGEID